MAVRTNGTGVGIPCAFTLKAVYGCSHVGTRGRQDKCLVLSAMCFDKMDKNPITQPMNRRRKNESCHVES